MRMYIQQVSVAVASTMWRHFVLLLCIFQHAFGQLTPDPTLYVTISNTSVSITYFLPTNASNSVMLVLTGEGGNNYTLSELPYATGNNTYVLPDVAVDVYNFTLSYRDFLDNPPASATVVGISVSIPWANSTNCTGEACASTTPDLLPAEDSFASSLDTHDIWTAVVYWGWILVLVGGTFVLTFMATELCMRRYLDRSEFETVPAE